MGDKYPLYILGLDLGVSSLGWSMIEVDNEFYPKSILNMGVRVFNPGLIDAETSNAATPASERRAARMIRRQTDRRRRRKLKTYYILKNKGFWSSAETRAEFIERIDRETVTKYINQIKDPTQFVHVIPYYLRARALDHQLSIEELGRVFYHLAQRRGFLSNRKGNKKEDIGVVKKGISELHQEIKNTQSRTLGEYLSHVDPSIKRIRDRYTGRDMYVEEFISIFEKQKQFYPDIMTDSFKKELYLSLFHQRKLKSARHLVGNCEYEKGSKHCPWYRPDAQDFRIWQILNNISIHDKKTGTRLLTKEEKLTISNILLIKDGISISDFKKVLGLSIKDCKINFENGGETRIKGNRTNNEMIEIFGESWLLFDANKKEEILKDINSDLDDKHLTERAMKRWNLSKDSAELFSSVSLEEGYCGLSWKAIKKLLPLMKDGLTYPEAVKKVYGDFHTRKDLLPSLPIVQQTMKNLTNPMVRRCLTEVRLCVNAIIKKYGKPLEIHIELAREMKKGKKERENISKDMKENEKQRQASVDWLKEKNIFNPSREDIAKHLLAEECHWICPYTGRSISFDGLFGLTPEFDIEHIIPLSRSLDDSFANKTICYNQENRSVKKNRTPFEAYSNQSDKYDEIILRVKTFRSKYSEEKLRRFQLKDISIYEDCTERLMNDTRYASKLSMEYLSHLYGGLWDDNGDKKVFCNSGAITAYIRRYFSMSRALGGEKKNRDDHRHHAVDACAIALTSSSTIKSLSEYARNNWIFGRTQQKSFNEPWAGFQSQLLTKLASIIPVHHVGNKVRGKLHEETFYGLSDKEGQVTIRKKLESISKAQIEDIKDEYIRGLVIHALKENGGKDPNKVFSNPDNLPRITGKDGIEVPVKSVIIENNLKTKAIGAGERIRNVKTGSNHHMEIVAVLDKDGYEIKWEGYIVSMLDAYLRKRNKESIIKRDFGEGRRYKFSLCKKTIIELEHNGKREPFVIRTVPETLQIFYVKLTEARKKKEIIESKELYSKTPETLRQAGCKKIVLTPLGEPRYSND